MYNSVTILGNLTSEPVVKTLDSGIVLCKLRIANNITRKDKKRTCFIDVTVWNKTAELCGEYLAKGSQVLVSGRLSQDSWIDSDGNKYTKHEINAESIDFLKTKERYNTNDRPSWIDEPVEDIPFD